MPAPAERPILMTAESVRGILDGRKTQTRRVVKPQPTRHTDGQIEWRWKKRSFWPSGDQGPELFLPPLSPYGVPGDRLWVKETLRPARKGITVYAENGCPAGIGNGLPKPGGEGRGESVTWPWGSKCKTVTMGCPRWASRITLELTAVRVERLQDISHKGALAEGVEYDVSKKDGAPIPRYQVLWNSINASRGFSWESNPWVWILEFKEVT